MDRKELIKLLRSHPAGINTRGVMEAAADMLEADAQPAVPQEPVVWQPIETAPKDGTPIIGWCVHEADPYFVDGKRLTLYGAHTEGLSHVADGLNVVVWGGAWDDRTWEEPNGAHLPDWWFRHGSHFEETANPTHWMPLPPAPGAAPQPQRPRLTDAEIDAIPFNGFTNLRKRFESENECLRSFARAIERKVRGER